MLNLKLLHPDITTREIKRIDDWLLVELTKLGLKEFENKKKLNKFLKKNKIEVKYSTFLATFYIMKNNETISQYKIDFSSYEEESE